MSNTWIDLTDLFEWRGHFTGIQRVTYNYASRYAEQGAHFFVYSSLYNRFVEIPFEIIGQHADEIPKRKIMKQKLKAHYKQLPGGVRTISSPMLRVAHKTFRKGAAMLLDSRTNDSALRKMPEAAFAKDDRIVLLDAGWNRRGLIHALGELKASTGVKIILHINDILPIYQPYLFSEELIERFTRYIHDGLKIANIVTVISEATQHDVIRYCKENDIDQMPIAIVRLGEDIKTVSPEKPNIPLDKDFIFCVGTFEIRKNYILLYQAVKLAQQEGVKIPQIVIAGRKGWLTHDLQHVVKNDPSIAGKFVHIDNASDANLSWMFDNCVFTVFSSLAEGWGLPIAESLQHGKLCLASNTSSMPEIAGDLIDYFSPYDVRACLDKIAHYAVPQNRLKKTEQIKKQFKTFTWDDSFKQYSDIVAG